MPDWNKELDKNFGKSLMSEFYRTLDTHAESGSQLVPLGKLRTFLIKDGNQWSESYRNFLQGANSDGATNFPGIRFGSNLLHDNSNYQLVMLIDRRRPQPARPPVGAV